MFFHFVDQCYSLGSKQANEVAKVIIEWEQQLNGRVLMWWFTEFGFSENNLNYP